MMLVKKTLDTINEGYETTKEVVRGIFGSECFIDEMAVMAASPIEAMNFLNKCLSQEGYEAFNYATDIVKTGPIVSSYDVQYWFFSTPFPYRIELMKTLNGFSPLHNSIDQDNQMEGMNRRTYVPVHASFKCVDEEDYGIKTGMLRKEGWEMVQRCQSGYGQFSYWRHSDDDTWLLKPRMNLRDAR